MVGFRWQIWNLEIKPKIKKRTLHLFANLLLKNWSDWFEKGNGVLYLNVVWVFAESSLGKVRSYTAENNHLKEN